MIIDLCDDDDKYSCPTTLDTQNSHSTRQKKTLKFSKQNSTISSPSTPLQRQGFTGKQ